MFLAYGSVKHMKIFTPGQCAGINRFVAIFAVPLLSFEFISKINPYKMDLRFVAADFISKLLILAGLSLWANFSSNGSLDWLITLFSLCTLPNTLVMGIPLLKSMYGDDKEGLMLQTLVLQCIIWYTLLLFLFEYRAARLAVVNQIKEAEENVAKTSKDDEEDDVIRVVVMSRSDVLEPDNVRINCSHKVAPAANSGQQQQQQVQHDDDDKAHLQFKFIWRYCCWCNTFAGKT